MIFWNVPGHSSALKPGINWLQQCLSPQGEESIWESMGITEEDVWFSLQNAGTCTLPPHPNKYNCEWTEASTLLFKSIWEVTSHGNVLLPKWKKRQENTENHIFLEQNHMSRHLNRNQYSGKPEFELMNWYGLTVDNLRLKNSKYPTYGGTLNCEFYIQEL